MYKGIDVSKWQGHIDWQRVKVDFAIIRAGISTSKDVCFEENYAEATTVKSTMYFGKKYSGVYKTIAPEIRKCTATTAMQDWTVSQNRALLTQTDIYDAIKKIAALYGVKVIDVFGESMMNTAFSQYVSETAWDSDHSVSSTEYCDTDGIHPLDKGYNQAYIPLIRKALQLGTDK